MDGLNQFLDNRVFWAGFIGWFSAQGIKILIKFIKEGKFDAERIMGSGGMPSSHSATITAVTFAIGETIGYDTSLFALAAVFSFIVMYDAANVRMESGKQAKVINRIIKELTQHTYNNLQMDRDLRELLGHTYLEVFVGGVLGTVIGILFA